MTIYLDKEKKYLRKMISKEREKRINISRKTINKIKLKFFGRIIEDKILLLEIRKKFNKRFNSYNAGLRYLKYLFLTGYKIK